jgi:hypothetical protein
MDSVPAKNANKRNQLHHITEIQKLKYFVSSHLTVRWVAFKKHAGSNSDGLREISFSDRSWLL